MCILNVNTEIAIISKYEYLTMNPLYFLFLSVHNKFNSINVTFTIFY